MGCALRGRIYVPDEPVTLDGNQEPPPLDGNTYRTWSKRWAVYDTTPGEYKDSPCTVDLRLETSGLALSRVSTCPGPSRAFPTGRIPCGPASTGAIHFVTAGPRRLRTSWHLDFFQITRTPRLFWLLNCFRADLPVLPEKSVRSPLLCAEFQIHPGTNRLNFMQGVPGAEQGWHQRRPLLLPVISISDARLTHLHQ